MLKIPQASLQQYVTENFQVYKLDLEKAEGKKKKEKKGRGNKDQIANIHWNIQKPR